MPEEQRRPLTYVDRRPEAIKYLVDSLDGKNPGRPQVEPDKTAAAILYIADVASDKNPGKPDTGIDKFAAAVVYIAEIVQELMLQEKMMDDKLSEMTLSGEDEFPEISVNAVRPDSGSNAAAAVLLYVADLVLDHENTKRPNVESDPLAAVLLYVADMASIMISAIMSMDGGDDMGMYGGGGNPDELPLDFDPKKPDTHGDKVADAILYLMDRLTDESDIERPDPGHDKTAQEILRGADVMVKKMKEESQGDSVDGAGGIVGRILDKGPGGHDNSDIEK